MQGGMEKHIASLTACQRADGHEVDIVFNQGDKTAQGDVPVLPSFDLFRLRPQVAAVAVFSVLSLLALARQGRRYDIVHVHGDWSSLLWAPALKRLCGAKVLAFTVHDDLTERVVHRRWLPFLARYTDVIFSTGFRAARALERSSGRPVIFRSSGVSEVFYSPLSSLDRAAPFTVLTVARLVRKKNLQLVLDIACLLPDLQFLIVGDGPEMAALSDRIRREALANVRLVGKKAPAEIRELMASAHCFLLTSLEEGTPTALLEAMARGLPVVTAPAGGIGAIVKDAVNGYVIESYQAEHYVDRIRQLFDDALRMRMAAANLALATSFRWPAVAADVSAAMQSALSMARGRENTR